MRFSRLAYSFLLLTSCFCSFANVVNHFDKIKKEPNALYAFLKEMPKGGELHYHLAGGAYPEVMLKLATSGTYCLNKETLGMVKSTGPCQGVPAHKVVQQPSLYDEVIRAWSMKDFIPGKETGHDHFFATFYKFLPLISAYHPELLTDIMLRAANQNEQYLEIMILPDDAKSIAYAPVSLSPKNFASARQELLANKEFQNNIQFTIDETARILKKARQELGCEQETSSAVCKLTVKFQYYVLREQPLAGVFAQALNAFEAASRSKELLAVNLVQPEDGLISLRDYRQQMQIFNFLHQLYPKVHISLHAGELAPTDVRPEDLRFHIREAIHIGHAERIGHGVAIAFEDKAEKLVAEMAKKPVPVEINLTSNQKILNVSGKQHPLNYYLAHQVPVVLSTDDEGILRTDLTQQYVEAVYKHGIDYPTLKTINRNALTYSFLPGKSLWADAAKGIPVEDCKDLKSTSCLQFIKESEKARLQWQLEEKLNHFEAAYDAPMYEKLKNQNCCLCE